MMKPVCSYKLQPIEDKCSKSDCFLLIHNVHPHSVVGTYLLILHQCMFQIQAPDDDMLQTRTMVMHGQPSKLHITIQKWSDALESS